MYRFFWVCRSIDLCIQQPQINFILIRFVILILLIYLILTTRIQIAHHRFDIWRQLTSFLRSLHNRTIDLRRGITSLCVIDLIDRIIRIWLTVLRRVPKQLPFDLIEAFLSIMLLDYRSLEFCIFVNKMVHLMRFKSWPRRFKFAVGIKALRIKNEEP